jgi:hypothetical protein
MTKPVVSAPTTSLKVRRLKASDVTDYRELRLESLLKAETSAAVAFERISDEIYSH